jgi:hypothetical protein
MLFKHGIWPSAIAVHFPAYAWGRDGWGNELWMLVRGFVAEVVEKYAARGDIRIRCIDHAWPHARCPLLSGTAIM